MEFDPYYQWLGIPPEEQPPHFYRLLGLRLFETNRDAIEHAADRQMIHLRTFQGGKNGAASQQLLNEVSAARRCLMDPERKDVYDQQLQAEQTAYDQLNSTGHAAGSTARTPNYPRSYGALPVEPRVQPPRHDDSSTYPMTEDNGAKADANPSIQINAEETHSGDNRRRKRRKSSLLMEFIKIVLGGIAGCILSLCILYYGFNRDPFQVMKKAEKVVAEASAKLREQLVQEPTKEPEQLDGNKLAGPEQGNTGGEGASKNITPETSSDDAGTSVNVDTAMTETDETPRVNLNNPVAVESLPIVPKAAVPSPQEQQEAMPAIEQAFRIASAKTVDEKKALIRNLTSTANENRDRPAERFMMLRKAMELSQDIGSSAELFRVIEVINLEFAIDVMSVRERMLLKTLANVRDEKSMEEYLPLAKLLIDEAIAESRLDIAKKIVDASYEACNNKPFALKHRKYVFDGRRHVLKLYSLWDDFQNAERTLAKSPDDPEANRTVGLWLALYRDEWAAAFPYLVKCGQEKLQTLAAAEMARTTDTAEQIKMADAWFDLSRSSEEYKNMGSRARYWYAQVLPVLSGLERVRVESRLGELGEQKGIYAERIALWNSNVSITDHRATTRCHVLLLRGGAIVWQRRDVRVNHNRSSEAFSLIDLPALPFDTIRIDVVDWYKEGAGLAEVEVFQRNRNIALGRMPTVSDTFTPSSVAHPVRPEALTDGYVPKKRLTRGYWFLPSKARGWIELSFKDLAL